MPVYRLLDRTGNDLGFLEHPMANLGPRDVVALPDGQEARVATRIDGDPASSMVAAEAAVGSLRPRARASESTERATRVLFWADEGESGRWAKPRGTPGSGIETC